MPRRRKTLTSYREYSSGEDHDADDPSILQNIVGLLMTMQRRSAQKRGRKKTTRTPKRKSSANCDCVYCSVQLPKKRCVHSKTQPKGKGKTLTAPSSTSLHTSINLESDDEEPVNSKQTEINVDNMKSKVDNFFKALDSDDEDMEFNAKKPSSSPKSTEPKSKDFYTILTDSEDEKEQPCSSANITNSFSEPSTSGISNLIGAGIKLVSNTLNIKPDRKPEDLFAYVDDILNDCNIVDISSDKPKESNHVESLEALNKRTNEILGDITSVIDALKPKPAPVKPVPESPKKDAPACPICLENLGGSRQTMATLCGHMFCEPCIAQVAKTSKKCPTCRKNVTKTKYHPVYI